MRRIAFILICLWVVANSFAVTYSTYQPTGTDFRSTSAYVQSTAGYSQSSITNRATGSMTAISASNFSTLNSEGGACYIPSATRIGPRRVKIDEPDTEAVGEGVWESPVGDTPFLLLSLLVLLYVLPKLPRVNRE